MSAWLLESSDSLSTIISYDTSLRADPKKGKAAQLFHDRLALQFVLGAIADKLAEYCAAGTH